ncbi:MAG: protein-tyrosine phosphatase [Flavobacteriales bacterium]|jgi:protein-tyrosine phosphatase
MKKILFLCTGNYYRSRFSEEYFNHFAGVYGIPWQADSMGIQRTFEGNGNVGPIAQNTLDKLASLSIQPLGHERFPVSFQESHFNEFDRIIAVSLDEHKPMLEEIWELGDKNVEYFDVEDLHIEGPETALPRLIIRLDNLIDLLKPA